jgi:uncharacterized membrane protein
MDQNMVVFVGIALIFIGIFIVLLGSLTGKDSKTSFTVGGFIGPIPFGFGNDPQMLKIVAVIAVVVFVIFMLNFFKVF